MTGRFKGEVVKSAELDAAIIRLQYDAPDPKRSLLVEIVPHYGSNLYRYRVGESEVIYCDNELLRERDWTGTFVLWPLPNRVRGKQYEFEGDIHSLKEIKRRRGNEPLIHGLVDDMEWQFEEPTLRSEKVSARTWIEINRGSPIYKYYPYPSELTLDYILSADGIRIEYTVENLGHKNMPFGFALHPYFSLLSGPDKTLVTLPAEHIMEADEELLPTGELLPMGTHSYDLRRPTPVSTLELDHVFTGLHDQADAAIEYPEQNFKISLKASPDFTHMVLYTLEAAKDFICFENQTGSTDMINLHAKAQKNNDEDLARAAHLLVLSPGNKHTGHIMYGVRFKKL